MKYLALSAAALLAAVAVAASAGTSHELLKSTKNVAPMMPGTVHHASLFSPRVLITIREPGWQGGQYANHGYGWL
jgi:hypothetical protein